MITILLVDDHAILREGLRRAFESAGEHVVGEAANGVEAVTMARDLRPDVVVMDLSMPVLDGVEATRRITADVPDTRVVVLSMHDDVERTRAAIAAGAVGYLSKGCEFSEVLPTVRAAANGDTSLSPALASEMLAVIDRRGEETFDPDDEEPLSPRQTEILQLIADGMTTKQAAREMGITQKTVHNHLNAIYRRLDEQNLTHAILRAVRMGLIDLD